MADLQPKSLFSNKQPLKLSKYTHENIYSYSKPTVYFNYSVTQFNHSFLSINEIGIECDFEIEGNKYSGIPSKEPIRKELRNFKS